MPTKTKSPKMLRKNFDKWLAKQPANREFNYLDIHACLFSSFLNETMPLRTGKYSCGSTWATPRNCEDRTIIFPSWARRVNTVALALNCLFTVADLRANL